MSNPNELTIAEARDALRKGELSAVDLTMACLTAIDAGEISALSPWRPPARSSFAKGR